MDYQGTRTRQGLTFVDSVPTAAYHEGDFAGAVNITHDDDSFRVYLYANGVCRKCDPVEHDQPGVPESDQP